MRWLAFHQLDTAEVLWREGASAEEPPPSAIDVGIATPGWVGPGLYKRQAEQAMKRESSTASASVPVSSFLPQVLVLTSLTDRL